MEELGDRAYGPLLVICALPEALPSLWRVYRRLLQFR
ncbi:hypothetical protein [Chroococcidiopsis cubana]|nr:hypothetical protein [Chroococcidiopsis cubana]